jgi:uncharacterized protein (TIGR03435 family)
MKPPVEQAFSLPCRLSSRHSPRRSARNLPVPLLTAALAIGLIQAQVSYVASVKPNRAADARSFSEYLPGGRLTATAVTVVQLLRTAYRIQGYQLVGAPGWIATKRFDIEAKADANPAPSQQALLQALLAERFHLVARRETREMPTFALVLARKDEKLGAQLIRSDFDCAAYRAGPHGLPEPGRTPPCATRIGPGALSGKAITMAQLATSLGPLMSRFTVDRTGLSGVFDVELTWTPDAAADPSAPPLVTALVEQLGLKLVSEKGPVEVLVVDRIEEPSGNQE